MGLRSSFGLSAMPCSSVYQFGGFANLSFLQPTAGREAVNRDSIDQVSRLDAMAERAASEILGKSLLSDKNTAFMQWIINHRRYDLCPFVTIRVLPDEADVPLADAKGHIGTRIAHYYTGVTDLVKM